jgi:hypothetical protein
MLYHTLQILRMQYRDDRNVQNDRMPSLCNMPSEAQLYNIRHVAAAVWSCTSELARSSVLAPHTAWPWILAPQTARPSLLAPQTARPSLLAPQTAWPSILAPQTARPSLLAPQTASLERALARAEYLWTIVLGWNGCSSLCNSLFLTCKNSYHFSDTEK